MSIELNLASANNFQVIFPKLPNEEGVDRKLVLYAYGSVLPAVGFTESIESWQGWEVKTINSTLQFENWNINFSIDDKFDNWKRLFNWMAYINNNKDEGGKRWIHSAVNTSLQVFDNYERKILEIKFNKMLPVSLEEVTLSFREGETDLSSGLRLIYDYFTIER